MSTILRWHLSSIFRMTRYSVMYFMGKCRHPWPTPITFGIGPFEQVFGIVASGSAIRDQRADTAMKG